MQRPTLWDAIESNDLGLLRELLTENPTWNTDPHPFGSWLHYASGRGKTDVVKYLVECGADVNLRGGTYDAGPIESAASSGHEELVNFLLAKGAVIDVSGPERNPLFGAISSNSAGIARLLLDHGLDPYVTYRSITGKLKNALSYAEEHGSNEIATILRELGCTLPVDAVPKVAFEKTDTHADILARLEKAYGPIEPLSLREIIPVDPDIHVVIHAIRPNENHPHWTFFTTGMSDKALPEVVETVEHAELIMHLPASWQMPANPSDDPEAMWPLQWMRRLAYFPHQARTSLGGAYMVFSNDDPPQPLGRGTEQTCWLLMANADSWSPVFTEDDRMVNFYTLMPLFTEERDFEQRRGVHRLLERMARKGIAILTVYPNRQNACG